jgi:hypothetical protein
MYKLSRLLPVKFNAHCDVVNRTPFTESFSENYSGVENAESVSAKLAKQVATPLLAVVQCFVAPFLGANFFY